MLKPLIESKIAIIGLGYVGLPLAVAFAEKYKVIGIDINVKRVDELKLGTDATLEVEDMELQAALNTHFSLTTDIKDAQESSVFIVTVPAPTDKHNRPVGILESRVDSVKSALDGMMSAAAVETDQNQALVRMQARVPAAKKQMQIQMLTAMYGELVKNLELARFTLDREEPVIQMIDAPSMPLKKAGQGRLLSAVLGSFY